MMSEICQAKSVEEGNDCFQAKRGPFILCFATFLAT